MKIVLKHDEDRVKKWMLKIRDKALGVKFNHASSSGIERSELEKKIKAIVGFIAEQVMHDLLVKYNKLKESVSIKLDDSTSSVNQIDIRVIKKWEVSQGEFQQKEYEVEVRSSFPFFSIENTICKTFDVLGPYVNSVKVFEKEKDFYLRLLFALDYHKDNFVTYEKDNREKVNYNNTTINTLINDYFSEDFSLKKDLTIFFVGGATKEMMRDESISYIGTMESDIFNNDKGATFKKIKLRNSIDAISMLNIILSVSVKEHLDGR
jgi:hypothetical protein